METINTNVSPWLFKHGNIGWGYLPYSLDQFEFFIKNIDDYPSEEYKVWILKFNQFKNNY